MDTIEEIFKDTYPKLAKQLEELGIKTTTQLKERFESNGKYVSEVLDYDLKDNEKIRSIFDEKTAVEKSFNLFAFIVLAVIALLTVWMFNMFRNL